MIIDSSSASGLQKLAHSSNKQLQYFSEQLLSSFGSIFLCQKLSHVSHLSQEVSGLSLVQLQLFRWITVLSCAALHFTESQNPSIVRAGRDLWRSSSPTLLQIQVHLDQVYEAERCAMQIGKKNSCLRKIKTIEVLKDQLLNLVT